MQKLISFCLFYTGIIMNLATLIYFDLKAMIDRYPSTSLSTSHCARRQTLYLPRNI